METFFAEFLGEQSLASAMLSRLKGMETVVGIEPASILSGFAHIFPLEGNAVVFRTQLSVKKFYS